MPPKKKILITDDDPSIQDVLKIIFEKAGYEVTASSDAKCILDKTFDYPDLILLDRQLSGLDGLDVCRFLKCNNDTKDIPVIMISASPGIGYLSKAAGAEDFVEKPFGVKHLLATVARWANINAVA